jgi:ABC transport system ATP-binding/permease protein
LQLCKYNGMPSVLQIEGLSKYIGDLVLFEDANIQLNKGDKAALIGVNGVGKTSLLNLIAGNDSPDTGVISITSDIRLSYLPQDPVFPFELTVLEILFQSDNKNIRTIKEYEAAILTHDVKLIEKAVSKMDHFKLWAFENDIKSILTQLEITDFTQKAGQLSGGQQKRLAIAEVLLNEPELLILDEPTNHLDLSVIEWLENYLLRKDVSLLIVTHDRYFLDRICNTIFEIDQKKVYRYDGNYSRFVEQRQKRIEIEQQEVEKAQNLLRKEEDWMSRMPKARSTKAKYRIDNYYNLKEVSSKRRDDKIMKLNVRETRMGSKILEAKEVNFKWDDEFYVRDFSYKFSRFEKIGIIGSNGSGKSTFLELLTGKISPESGTISTGETIKIGYYHQAGMDFDENMKVLDAITNIAETIAVGNGTVITASQFLNYFLFPYPRQYDYIYKLSGGERRRLYLCSILMQNPNFLILDEPTNDLDITTLQVLEDYLADFAGCVLVVSHDRFFIDSVADHLFVFQGNGLIKDYPGNYTDYYEWKKKQEKITAESKQIDRKVKQTDSRTKTKLSFAEKKELEKLETEIVELEREKLLIENILNSGTLKPEELVEKSSRIGILMSELDKKSDRWLELSEKE